MMRRRAALFGIALALVLPVGAKPQSRLQSIPFVECPADGQAGPIYAPRGVANTATFDEILATKVAFYKGEHAPGVFAPRNWNCRAWYGSSGGTLVVTPTPISPPYFPTPTFNDHAVVASHYFGGTSGRFLVSSYVEKLFPSRVAGKPNLIAEFVTPANEQGLGTQNYLVPSQDAVNGIAALDEAVQDGPDLRLVRVRLGASERELESAILQLNKQCLMKTNGC
jgi:hypothetical protein